MMIQLHLPVLPIFLTILFSIYIFCFAFEVEASGYCNKSARSCGKNSLSYPFGFSDSCPIRLNCSASDGEIFIGEFKVLNVTEDSILVNIPMNCNRSISDIYQLFGSNYAVDSQNGLLLEGCNSTPEYCFIPNILGEDKIGFHKCDQIGSTNISCYSVGDNRTSEFMSIEDLELANCRFLLTSVAIDMPNTSNFTINSPVSLRFQSVKLGWWIIGNCSCSENAICLPILNTGEEDGFRCQCLEGFEGDGFADGDHCRKVDKCRGGLLFGHCGRSTKAFVLIGGIVLGASLMAITVYSWCIIKRRSKSIRIQMSAKRLLSEFTGTSSVHLHPYKEIEKATNYFSEKQRLGTGAYGTVYAGKLVNDDLVAIKKIRHRDATDGIEQVMNEIKLLSSVSHTNLVRLLGCCIENGEQILVFEFMPNGTLAQHLQRERGKDGLPWRTRLAIATETAQAIAYLHSMNPPIFHRDIKSSNILLDYSFKSKVADFGLSRFGIGIGIDIGIEDNFHSHVSTAPQGTPGYVDPQYHQNFHLSDKSDVYSFGVVLTEIITGMKAVDFSRSHTEVNLAALAIDVIGKGRLDEIIDPLMEPYQDAWTLSSIHKVGEMAFRCLAFHRDMRPSMNEVAEELDQIRLNGWAQLDNNDNTCMSTNSAAYTCSSPFNGSEKSFSSISHNSVVTLRKESEFTRY
ncbi:wall-associated receptor kinase-like 14 [Impatiens glandulifera]|uniref:wall-associated receptor kinase-like 14 n=1 Tax=Impatiens glandulifera TaxID=253017 RepID=UPI001FB12D6E|nr:wall-associated receptor kinase-like 14 [Impatiens glandulifera]